MPEAVCFRHNLLQTHYIYPFYTYNYIDTCLLLQVHGLITKTKQIEYQLKEQNKKTSNLFGNMPNNMYFCTRFWWFRSSVGLEQRPSKAWVLGSSPNGITETQKESFHIEGSLLFYLLCKNTGSLCLIYYYGIIIYNSIYV